MNLLPVHSTTRQGQPKVRWHDLKQISDRLINKETRTRSYYESEQSTVSYSHKMTGNSPITGHGQWEFAILAFFKVDAWWRSIIYRRHLSDTSLARESASDHEMVTSTACAIQVSITWSYALRSRKATISHTLPAFYADICGRQCHIRNPDLKAEHSNNFELGARYNVISGWLTAQFTTQKLKIILQSDLWWQYSLQW